VALDAWLRARAAAGEFSGVVLVRRADETLFSGAYGPASRRWPVPNTRATRFDTASVTKLFTAVAVLQLVDEGELALGTPIREIVELSGTTISPRVTLGQLLTHTSGIADDADEEAGESYEALWADKPVHAVLRTRDLLPQFAGRAPNFPPGAGCRYCNGGYVLAGLAIEAVTGTAYRDHIRAAVFARAGMTASDFYHRAEAVADVAEGWDQVLDGDRVTGWRQNIFSYPPIGSPDGGAHSTVDDLVRFLRAVRGGCLLSPEGPPPRQHLVRLRPGVHARRGRLGARLLQGRRQRRRLRAGAVLRRRGAGRGAAVQRHPRRPGRHPRTRPAGPGSGPRPLVMTTHARSCRSRRSCTTGGSRCGSRRGTASHSPRRRTGATGSGR
jgi:CubicO group peptidase (beta-lactamase class C family)